MTRPYKDLSNVVVDEKSTDSIEYSHVLIPSIYYNLNPKLRKLPWIIIKDEKYIAMNRNGFRSPEPVTNPDYLFAGCSVTYGWGLDLEDLWHEKLISSLGGSYSSVAMHGDSVTGQVLKIFAYIKEYGNPKTIVALFPDFNRFLSYNNNKMLGTATYYRSYNKKTFDWSKTKKGGQDDRTNEYLNFMLKNNATIDPNQSSKDYFKRPLVADEVITQEISHMYAAQFINMLSQYCEAAGIKFIWSTWDAGTERVINKVKNDQFFKEYISMEANNWFYDPESMVDNIFDVSVHNKDYSQTPIDCHSEYSKSETFHLANDRSLGMHHAHFGSHRHIHYYEKFLKHINEGGQ